MIPVIKHHFTKDEYLLFIVSFLPIVTSHVGRQTQRMLSNHVGETLVVYQSYFGEATLSFSDFLTFQWDLHLKESICSPSSSRNKFCPLKLVTFLCPRDDSQGALRFAPVCPSVCLSVRQSVCPSVRHALRYRVCVINSSHSFLWIFLKPCIPVVDILKMCM